MIVNLHSKAFSGAIGGSSLHYRFCWQGLLFYMKNT